MGYGEHIGSLAQLKKAFPGDFFGKLTQLMIDAEKAEKLLSTLDAEKQTRAEKLMADIDRFTRGADSAEQRLKDILPSLEANRQKANQEMAQLQTKHKEYETTNQQRQRELASVLTRLEKEHDAKVKDMNDEITGLTKAVVNARQQHAAFMERLTGAGR